MTQKQTNKEFLFRRWQSLRLYNIVILIAFLFFYAVGTLQSYSFFAPPAAFNLPLILPLTAIFLCTYLIHCLIANKDAQSLRLIPILTLFTTLFITINSHFETQTSQNSFLYFTLLLPLFYAYILSYNFQLLIANNLIAIISYTFTAVVGDTSTLVFILNLVFLFTLGFLTVYSHIKNNTYSSKSSPVKATRGPSLENQQSFYLKNIIHDIRQPLSSLALYSHLIKQQASDAQQSIVIENLMNASTQLDHWLSSLLELATLDTKTLPTNIQNVPVSTCFSGAIEKYRLLAKEKNIALKTHLAPCSLYSDAKILSEIIEQLLSNALIHGHQQSGKILLRVCESKTGVNIQVHNRGPNIAQAHLDSLFDEQYYPKNPQHNKAKGIGLGLALSQRKAQLLNTEILVKSTEVGCCFSLQVAKGKETEIIQEKVALSTESSESILLIDDDASILAALSMLLENWGYRVDCADNSQEALQVLAKNRYALIISDYRLPGEKNGIDLIKVAQKQQGIPAVLLTGEVDPDKLKEGASNLYKVLHKPIKPAALRLLLRQLLSH
ncbi:hypothetical protein CW745_10730 [Psychromonas sp. psych-6C06]|uniref:ATP-binding response regulator n=1 Tax=Psychromonas sp. psych-6C06 TaxID=2058089 RepID=UPI000C31CBBB|nr:hybrid sensor histidine kinase/response regulator [Psychromonas sp. psych-6C06]PKF61781.1 hypothetical protein CW745_10730 [Psychromonas sp. psych-6C06]